MSQCDSGSDQDAKTSHCFHVQNQHTDTFLAPAVDMLVIPDDLLTPAVDMLVILAPPHPPKYHDHQWIGSQFNRHNAGTVSAAPQRPKCQKHQQIHQRQVRVPQKRSHAVVQLPLPEFLNHIGSAQTEVFGRPAAAAFSKRFVFIWIAAASRYPFLQYKIQLSSDY